MKPFPQPPPPLYVRILAGILIPAQILTGNSVVFAGAVDDMQSFGHRFALVIESARETIAADLVVPNTTQPKFTPAPSRPAAFHFSSSPTDAEIHSFRHFEEPLLPNGKTTEPENAALAQALTGFSRQPGRSGLAVLEAFVDSHPQSPWNGAVLANAGIFYRQHGYYSRALAAWQASWAALKDAPDPALHPLADRVAGELASLLSSLGRSEALEPLLEEIKDRPLYGVAIEQIQDAHENVWTMKNKPGVSFKCGPYALDQIRAFQDPALAHDPLILQAASSPKGFSLDQVEALSQKLKMNYQMAKRAPGAVILTPSVVHWKSGHYAAVLKEEKGAYLVKDPTFGHAIHMGADAIDDESDGYFLVPQGTLPAGWQAVDVELAKTVWGRGLTATHDTSHPKDTDLKGPDNCSDNGMAVYSVYKMNTCLSVTDTALFYTPAVGPKVDFQMIFTQLPAAGNTGGAALLLHNWQGSIQIPAGYTVRIQPGNVPEYVTIPMVVRLRGGGTEEPDYSAPDPESGAVVTAINDGHNTAPLDGEDSFVPAPEDYMRTLTDGSVEIYDVSDGITTYLSKVIDPQGNAVTLQYDDQYRLVSITDASGLVTTVSYELAADSTKITKVTDPYGRFASFGYTTTAPYLLKTITDMIGIKSQLAYSSGTLLASLTTPYGVTTFSQSLSNGSFRQVGVTNPAGQSEYYISRLDGVGQAGSDLVTPTGSGFGFNNNLLNYRDSYYWNRITVANYGPPTAANLTNNNAYYSAAENIHWLHDMDTDLSCSAIPESIKPPLESRVWHVYPGQNSYYKGTCPLPSVTARVLDDGTSQVSRATYNATFHVTQAIDPLGRTTNTAYDTNTIDPLTINQVDGGGSDLLGTYTWDGHHRPLTFVDAAGQKTVFTYNGLEQPTSVKNAKLELTKLTYYTADATGKQRKNRLHQIIGALPGSANTITLDYDAFGNIGSVTNSDGYQLQFTYDNLSRPLRVVYPDGTYTETTYSRLDPLTTLDRLGRTTNLVYNSLRQLTLVTDPAGRSTQYTYCVCGALGQLIDAGGHLTTWKHDTEGRTTAKIYADGSQIGYAFGPNSGRLLSTTDEKGQVKTNSYNLDDTLSGIKYSNALALTKTLAQTPNVGFTYDPVYQRVLTMTDGSGLTTYAYNPVNAALGAGQLASVDGPLNSDTIFYSYDELGRIVNDAIGDAVTKVGEATTFDPAGRVTNITNPLGAFTYGYDGATQRLASAAHSGGVKSVFSYLPTAQDSRLQKIVNYKADGTTPLSIFSYTTDVQNRILTWKQQTDTAAASAITSTFGYDLADQVTSDVDKKGTTTTGTSSWQYDLAGNRTDAKVNGTETTSSYNALNELNNASATLPGATYEWDAEHRLVAINQGTARSEFSYDGLGRRVKIVEKTNGTATSASNYVWDGLQLREQRDASTAKVLQRYYAQGFQGVNGANLGLHLYTRDHLGSIREVVDTTGALQERISYDAWGKPTYSNATPISSFAYTGFFAHQPSGLQFATFRAYNATQGRWINRDPIEEQGGINLYRYVHNNPINEIDPLGFGHFSNLYSLENVLFGGLLTLVVTAGIIILAPVFVTTAAGALTLAAVGFLGLSFTAVITYLGQEGGDRKDKEVEDAAQKQCTPAPSP